MTSRLELAGNVQGGRGDRLGGAGAGHGEAQEMGANGVTASQAVLARPTFPKARWPRCACRWPTSSPWLSCLLPTLVAVVFMPVLGGPVLPDQTKGRPLALNSPCFAHPDHRQAV